MTPEAELSGDALYMAVCRGRDRQFAACMAMMIGLAASHFSRPDALFGRELLCLNFNFAFKAPVFAEQTLQLTWRVASVEWHERLGGYLTQVDGRAAVSHATPALVGRGTLLVKRVLL